MGPLEQHLLMRLQNLSRLSSHSFCSRGHECKAVSSYINANWCVLSEVDGSGLRLVDILQLPWPWQWADAAPAPDC